MTRILVTNNGPHSAENWAVATSEMVFEIDPAVVGDRLLSAKRLQMKIAEALLTHFEELQKQEQQHLEADPNHILTPHEAGHFVESVLKDVKQAAQKTPWQDHIAKPEVEEAMRAIIQNHLQTAQHVERLWHADKNPDSKQAQAYKNSFA